MNPALRRFFSVAEALNQLLFPQAEIVIHDLESGRIAAIYNNFSGRKVGDLSDLEKDLDPETLPDVFKPYCTASEDGRIFKSTTAALRDATGGVVGLMCINLDVTLMDQLQRSLSRFMMESDAEELPKELFTDQSREKISLYVRSYCSERGLAFNALTRAQKQEIVAHLYRDGAFETKGSADHIAHSLGISRATVYKYLALCRTA